MWPDYKTEEGVPEDLLAQFPLAERALEAIGGRGLADGASSKPTTRSPPARRRFAPEVEQVVICTPDKDLAQCVIGATRGAARPAPRNHLRRRGRARRSTASRRPRSRPARAGGRQRRRLTRACRDGARSPRPPCSPRWQHLESIPADPARWEVKPRGAERLAATLRDRMPDALLFRQLATLRRDVPLAESLEGLRWRGVPGSPGSRCARSWIRADEGSSAPVGLADAPRTSRICWSWSASRAC